MTKTALIIKITLLCLMSFLLPSSVIGQVKEEQSIMKPTSPFSVTQWTIDQGLPQNSVNEILQTKDGYIWIATFGGLARFDGIKFKVFNLASAPGLASNRILSLFEDSKGRLWIGHETSGITVYDNGRFVPFEKVNPMKSNVTCFQEDDEGNIWIGTSNGLLQYTNNNLIRFTTKDGLSSNYISSIAKDKENKIFILSGVHGYEGGLQRYQNGQFLQISNYSYSFSSILIDHNGIIWTGAFNGLNRIEEDTSETVLVLPKIFPPEIKSIFQFKNDNIFIATERGLHIYNPLEKETRVFDLYPNSDFEIITEDHEGNIWIGSERHGLFQLKRNPITRYNQSETVVPQGFSKVSPDGKGGVWMGSECGGLIHFQKGVFTKIKLTHNPCITSLLLAKDGTLWIGQTSNLETLGKDTFEDLVLPEALSVNNRISALLEDHEGSIWIGTHHGLFKFKEGIFIKHSLESSLQDENINFLTQTKDQSILIGTNTGFSQFKDSTFTHYTSEQGLSFGPVRAIYEDIEGAIWLGTYGGGLSRFKDGKFTRFTTANGLFDNVVSRLVEDKQHNLWMLGNYGLFYVPLQMLNDFADGKRDDISSVVLGTDRGMAEGNGAGLVAQSSDGRYWFPTIDGIAAIDINSFQINEEPPPVLIEAIQANEQDLDLSLPIELPPNQRDVEIHYTGLSYVSPEKVHFKYKLHGYDDQWNQAENRRVAYYPKLPHGNYTFQVMAANNDGIWNEEGISIPITIIPTFWETRYAKALYVILTITLILIAFRLQTNDLKKKQRLLENKVEERTQDITKQKNKILKTNKVLSNTVDKLKSTQSQLIQSEKMAALGVLTAGIAHEINNPINFVSVGASGLDKDFKDLLAIVEALKDLPEDPKKLKEQVTLLETLKEKHYFNDIIQTIPQTLEDINEGVKRTIDIVKGLLLYSRSDNEQTQQGNIHESIESALLLLKNKYTHNIDVVKNFDTSIQEITCYPGQLNQVFINLLDNAVGAIENSGTITINTKLENKQVIISIHDTGKGIPEEDLSKILDPFFTTKVVGQGTGLGLSICQGIIEKHKGTIKVKSKEGEGSEFIITIPINLK